MASVEITIVNLAPPGYEAYPEKQKASNLFAATPQRKVLSRKAKQAATALEPTSREEKTINTDNKSKCLEVSK